MEDILLSLEFADDVPDLENVKANEDAEREYQNHLEILKQFEKDGDWCGMTTSKKSYKYNVHLEALSSDFQVQLNTATLLKKGRFGTVSEITYRNVALVRKSIPIGNVRDKAKRDLLREEARIGGALDSHQHIIKLVGTYYENCYQKLGNDSYLHILTFPVATCDLDQFLHDCEEISAPVSITGQEYPDTFKRLVKMGFLVGKSIKHLRVDMRIRLQEIMGCLTESILWMHSNDYQHRDIKPANILLRPGQVLLTDFGIARDRRLSDFTTTETYRGHTDAYAPPEVRDRNNPRQWDIFSLGCVFLHILTVIYGPNVELKMIGEVANHDPNYFRLRQFKEFIAKKGVATQHQILPFRYQGLIANMLDDDRSKRPSAAAVSTQLRLWSSEKDHYHGICCRREPTSSEMGKVLASENSEGFGETRSTAASQPMDTGSGIKLSEPRSTRPGTLNGVANVLSDIKPPVSPDKKIEWSDTAHVKVRLPLRHPTFEFPAEKKWYRIITETDGIKRALQADDDRTIVVAPLKNTGKQCWQFKISGTRSRPVNGYSKNDLIYWISNMTLDPNRPLAMGRLPAEDGRSLNDYPVCIEGPDMGRTPSVLWHFSSAMGSPATYLYNEDMNSYYTLGYRKVWEECYVARMFVAKPARWSLEEVDLPYEDTSISQLPKGRPGKGWIVGERGGFVYTDE